jgi:hypothetical protein
MRLTSTVASAGQDRIGETQPLAIPVDVFG